MANEIKMVKSMVKVYYYEKMAHFMKVSLIMIKSKAMAD